MVPMSSPSARDDVQLLLRVARLYYEENWTQAQIADAVGYSRPSISRLLTQAREAGIVRITISHPLERILSIEARLKTALGLTAVRVTESSESDSFDHLGITAADLLVRVTSDGQVLAVGNGRSVAAVSRHVPDINRTHCTVVQMLGSLPGGPPSWGRDAPTVCHHIAKKLGATSARMAVPLIVDDPALLRPLMREEKVATTLALAARADVALVGVAGVDAYGEGNILAEYMTPPIQNAIRDGGAVGHILDHHYDATGAHVPTPLTPRTLALSLDELRAIPLVIGVASGPEKAGAIVAAARGGILNAVVTDYDTAKLMLERIAPRR